MKSMLFLLLTLSSLSWAGDKIETFNGEIADSSCAYNVHSLSRSHKEMLKSKEWGNNAADCTRRCVQKFGASYVLVHGNNVYRLEQQNLAEPFAGQQVTISGTLGGNDGTTIHIAKIEAAK
jgi:hypothetical protein